jgi:hypothetical protein
VAQWLACWAHRLRNQTRSRCAVAALHVGTRWSQLMAAGIPLQHTARWWLQPVSRKVLYHQALRNIDRTRSRTWVVAATTRRPNH